MKFKKLIITALFLLFILTISTVSATSNKNNTISSDLTDKLTIHQDNNQIDDTKNHNTLTKPDMDTKKIEDKIYNNPKNNDLTQKNEENIIYVNKSSTSGIEDGTKANPYKTINQKVINNLETSTTINIANGKYELNSITLNKNLIFIGQNRNETILYTNSKNGLFNITHNINLKIVNLTIRDYTSTITPTINNDGILTIENVFFQNATRNINIAKGGFIYNTNSLTIKNSIFDIAKASYGAFIYNNNAQAIIINSTFTNSETLNVGGAIYSLRSKMEVYNSTFMYNKAVSGAAIYNAFGNLTVNNTYFYKNDAKKFFGGAIYNTGQTITTNSRFIENYARKDGGAITNTCYFYSINCTYDSNRASENGGVIENIPVNETETGNLILINNIFSKNIASKGGVIINYKRESLNGIVSITNARFIENSADEGGAIYNERTLTITDSTFQKNKATTGRAIWTNKGENVILYNTNIIGDENDNNTIYAKEGSVIKLKPPIQVIFEISHINDFIKGSPITITVTETNNKNTFNGTVTLNIGTEKYQLTLINGKATKTITPNLNPGKYNIILTFTETNNYTSASAKSNTFTVTTKTTKTPHKKNVKIYLTLKKVKKVSKNIKKLYLKIIVKSNNKKVITKNIILKVKRNKVKIKKSKPKTKITPIQNFKFTIKINNKTYLQKTNNKGKTTFKITNIYKKGAYTVKISYKSIKFYKNSKTIKFKIKK